MVSRAVLNGKIGLSPVVAMKTTVTIIRNGSAELTGVDVVLCGLWFMKGRRLDWFFGSTL